MQALPRQPISSLNFWIDKFIPWIVLAILLTYTYALFILSPYVGFDIDPSDGMVESLFVQAQPGADLQVGDRLIEVGNVLVSDYLTNLKQALFVEFESGQVVPIFVQRGMERLVILWVMPGPNPQEIQYRLLNIWWLAYVFWICGIAVKYSVRPKDSQWRLLILFFFLTSIWLISGTVSPTSIWMSPIVFRSAVWLSIPVLLHLHWIMPKPLGKIPDAGLWLVYAAFFVLSIAEWFLVIPIFAYIYGFMLGFVVGVVLLGLHYIFQPALRKELNILGLAFLLAIIPLLAVSLARTTGTYPPAEGTGVLALPALPVAYFYVISRKKLGSLELRTNRLISIYIFLILLGIVILTIMPLFGSLYYASDSALFPSMAIALLSGLFVVMAFPRFERWMDRRVYGITVLPENIIEEYSSRISTSLDVNSIEHLLKDEFLPSLLVRQSALIRFNGKDGVSLIYANGTECSEMPEEEEIDRLWAAAGRYIPPTDDPDCPYLFPWTRLILSMKAGGERVGMWLLGQRDPDDFYSQGEISKLQSIADQTASALVNAEQAAQLHALYQANIERHEEERNRLASDLHDEVLNQLAVLSMNMDGSSSPELEENLELVNDRLRKVISGLRPAMLNYGLQAGLEELVDEISERTRDGVVVRLEIPSSQLRYEPRVEGHLYRIIQQATENAVRHSGGQLIRIYGDLKPDSASLVVEDDGTGFPDADHLNFDHFLAQRHFGLARMFERAAIIGAELSIHSINSQGTRVSVDWLSNQSSSPVRV